MKYDITYLCGHKGTIDLIGPEKMRTWKLEREAKNHCPSCWKQIEKDKREEENQRAAQKGKEMELPELEGTKKQVAWANTIRIYFLEEAEKRLEGIQGNLYLYPKEEEKNFYELQESIYDLLKGKTESSFWIEERKNLFKKVMENIEEKKEKQREEEKEERREYMVKPEKVMHPGVVYIAGHAERITVQYEKNETFINIVKSHGLKWDGALWERALNERTGSWFDRATELGNLLLQNGFTIHIPDKKAISKAITANYSPECKRWIIKRGKKLGILWDKKEGNFYEKARRIKTAKWKEGAMEVEVQHYPELEDFAEILGFRFTLAAKTMIEEYKQDMEKIRQVIPSSFKEDKEKDRLKEMMQQNHTIIEDLLDD